MCVPTKYSYTYGGGVERECQYYEVVFFDMDNKCMRINICLFGKDWDVVSDGVWFKERWIIA